MLFRGIGASFPRLGAYFLYASAIFLSAFLLFQVQPIVGKHLLPWFGGSSSVWATSLLFFTTMLFVGYLYVYVLQKWEEARQARVHLYVVGVGGFVALVSPIIWRSFYPPLDWTLASTLAPSLEVLISLFLSIGIPYFLLSTTGPLMQYWYGLSEKREPYKLYALSNIGSLLALATYPFLVEPHMRLASQEAVWTALFILYVALAAAVCNRFYRSEHVRSAESTPGADSAPISLTKKSAWVLLAALPSLLLVATTTQITQVVAPIPFLWLLPLCLYLISFIFAFWGWGRGALTWLGVLLFAAFAYAALDVPHELVVWRLIADLGLLFFCGLFCHGALYGMRPAVSHVPLFYLLISFGGMLGAMFASLVAPLIFNELHEFPLAIAAAALAAFALVPAGAGPLFAIRPRMRTVIRFLIILLIVRAAFTYLNTDDYGYETLSATRNFYGTAKVQQFGDLRYLMHGATLHGTQSLDPEKEFTPANYYSTGSGVARAIVHEYVNHLDRTMKVAVIGLGTGNLSVYCGEGDQYVFYEIDSRVVSLAKEYFTYSTRCDGFEVRLGDARIVLEDERRRGELQKFDVIAVDAFNDDTIPVHLITKEAIQLYLDHLAGSESIIAVHTSNRYLDLPPAIVSVAESLGLTAFVVSASGEEDELASSSEWVLLSRDPNVSTADAFESALPYTPERRIPVWTDDYADVLSVVWIPDEAFQYSTLTGMFDALRYRVANWILPETEEEAEEEFEETENFTQ